MSYVRKTYDEFEIQSNYGYGDGWECLTTESNRREALKRAKEYRDNQNEPVRIVKKRVKKQ